MKYSYDQLAKMIDHSLLHPTMTDKELEDGCAIAKKYDVASVCIKPYYVRRAAELLRGSGVLVGAVIGFPHGNNPTESKRYETELACRDGAVEIDMVINIGKALSADWNYVEQDIRAVCEQAHKQGAIVKVIFENDFLPNDEIKIRLCEISERAGADYVTVSPVFVTASKPGYGPALGLDALGKAARLCPGPVVALGGIDAANLGACLAAGARGIAVMGEVMRAADPEATVSRMIETLEKIGSASP